MQVYIEYAIADNFVIDYLLLKVTFALTGRSVGRKRLFLCSLLGVVGALIIPLVSTYGIFQLAIKTAFLLLMVVLVNKKATVKEYLYFASIFLGLTFLTGGTIVAIYDALKIDYSSDISIATMIIPVSILLRGFSFVIKSVYKRRNVVRAIYKTQLELCGRTISCDGFLDTGNSVYFENSPVIFCAKKTFQTLIGIDAIKKMSFVEISTLAGRKRVPCVKLDRIVIYFADKPNIYENVSVCVVKRVGMGYDVILHPDLYGDVKDETDRAIKKTS